MLYQLSYARGSSSIVAAPVARPTVTAQATVISDAR